ncbi:MAG: iron-sulfur cluster assembly scaffold protein [Deltaproteobacteria bacterium]|nr:iron-sulfur cluster assembly scaffold protein [Deltaproteobacteria bacterium]
MKLSEWGRKLLEKLGFRSGHTCIETNGVSEVARGHAMCPRNFGSLDDFQGHARVTGPCGDTIEIWLAVEGGIVSGISFVTTGCGPSMASGSMATTLAKGRSVEDAAALRQKDVLDALQGLPAESEHCALLAVNTIKAACDDYMERRKGDMGNGHQRSGEL